jgi:hypothetical protein
MPVLWLDDVDVAVLASASAVHGVAALDYAMRQSLDVVWWKVFVELGREVSLEDVRRWNDERQEKNAADLGPPGDEETVVIGRVRE